MKALDERLIESGLVSKTEVEQAKAVQRKSGFKLVEYLRRQGALKEDELMEFVSKQLKIEKFDPEKHHFDPEFKEILPEDMVRKGRVLPIKKVGSMLWVATDDPMNITVLDQVEAHTKLDVEPIYCPRHDLEELIYANYGGSAQIGDILGTLEEMDVETDADSSEDIEDISGDTLKNKAEEAPVIRLVNQILAQAAQEGASDVHISPQRDRVSLRFRIDGQLKEFPGPPKSAFLAVSSRLKLLSNMDISVTRVPQDGRFAFKYNNKEVNIRASALPTIYGENIVMRLLTASGGSLSLGQLGLVEDDQKRIERAIMSSYGMVLATGPTGSGKTTLLYSLLQALDKPNVNIITLEDPVEKRIDTIRQVQMNSKAGMTFASGLRSILRQDPDIILIGEIRDGETAHIGVESAMTGHMVLSTLHTNTATAAVSRLMDMGVEPFLVASTLLCAIGQRLVRRVCSKCKEEYEPEQKYIDALKFNKKITFYHGKGCNACNNTGYKGRLGIYEVLSMVDEVQQMIMQLTPPKELAKNAVKLKALRTMQTDALNKVVQGLTTIEEAAPIIFMT